MSSHSSQTRSADPVARAKLAGLRHVTDDTPGYTRRRQGKGFSYWDIEGNCIPAGECRDWIESLVIPPAWQDVWICQQRDGHLLATGRDADGRKQYLYHPEWETASTQSNFARLQAFGQQLERIRTRVDGDLRRHGLARERILALVVHLLDETLIRIGNSQYARSNQSFGLTTLRTEHAELASTSVKLAFTGKSGKWTETTISDARIAKLIARCEELPGDELFQYVDDSGDVCSVDSADVNDYLQRTTRQAFTAKDFRTWGGTVVAAEHCMTALSKSGSEDTDIVDDYDKLFVAATKAAAESLNNTPAICRAHYIHPYIFAATKSGELLRLWKSSRSGNVSRAERTVLKLLQQQSKVG